VYPAHHARLQPDKPAVLRPSTGEVLTYRQLDDNSNRLAQLLRAYGLGPGDNVALYLDNQLAFFEALWACLRSGLYFTPINHHLSASEAAYIVDNCDAKALIAGARLEGSEELGRLSPRPDVKLSVGGSLLGYAAYQDEIARHPAEKLASERLGSMMMYSSGTTGRPKGIRRPPPDSGPEDGIPSFTHLGGLFGVDGSTVYLSTAPMYHAAPCGFSVAVHQAGGTLVMMDRFDAETALRLIERHRVTHSQWVPSMFIRLLKLDEATRGRYDLSSHRTAIHAAAPCPVEVKRRMIEWWGPILVEYYSSTENAGMAVIDSQEWLAHPGSVGRSRGQPFHICDEDGRELPPGVPGLIYGEAPVSSAPFSYHKDAEKTAGATHPDHSAWMTVGDVGYLDEEGYLYLTDRKAFMIISGGVNIYPQQIEDVLALHPKIADVAVIGVPNEDLGEEVKAVIEPAPGVETSDALAQEILDFVREKLGRQLTPRSVDFIDQLPRLATGKLYKKALRATYWGETAPTAPLATHHANQGEARRAD
jgi:long-chain acyl-CoA synthetase